ncbi:MAG: peptide chain release factor-like protein [Elusimicrobia bacterium]|nr:peptide chain release factor-like protein [Elusimicrobiota bacterium]
MDLNEHFDVSPQKLEELKSRIARLAIDLRRIEESFVRGGGKGGQKINKTANCVQLYYPPLDIRVRCQRERRRSLNRFLALRELVDQIEMKVSPATSRRLAEMERLRKRKAKRQGRARSKYGSVTPDMTGVRP